MSIDFAIMEKEDLKLMDFASRFSKEDLRAAANESVDYLMSLVSDLTDADVTFDPVDENADDPHAVAGEENIGWSVAHLIAHITSSTEEWAAYSSILARGVEYPAEPRLRYETPWKDLTTQAQVVQRLQESRRMRNAFLDTWPDAPFLDTKRDLSPRFIERFGDFNAPAAFLFGLKHELGHYEQIEEVKRQALAARATV
ncbi:MAG: DinB family protein [Aggregatilineales bacterium]